MSYLIDTHILIWLSEEPSRLSPNTTLLLRDMRHDVYISIVSLWEMAIKMNIGKLSITGSLDTIVPDTYSLLPLIPTQLNEYVNLPHHHRDPFDRMLIAQARNHKLTIVTKDPIFAKYDVKTLVV